MSGPSATVFSTVRKGKMHCFTCSVTVLFIPSLSLTHTHNPATHTLALTCTCMINQTPSKYTKKLRKQKHILKAKQSNNKTPQHYHILTSNEKVKNTHHSKTKWTISIKVRVSTKETECVCVCVCYTMTWFQHQRSNTVGWTVPHFWPVLQANWEKQQLSNCLQRQNQPC